MNRLNKLTSFQVSLLQSISLISYIALVALLMWNGEKLFGSIKNPLGPLLFLTLFVSSALICALISLSYPIWVFWEKKDTKKALIIVAYEASIMAIFSILVIVLLLPF